MKYSKLYVGWVRWFWRLGLHPSQKLSPRALTGNPCTVRSGLSGWVRFTTTLTTTLSVSRALKLVEVVKWSLIHWTSEHLAPLSLSDNRFTVRSCWSGWPDCSSYLWNPHCVQSPPAKMVGLLPNRSHYNSLSLSRSFKLGKVMKWLDLRLDA